MSFVLERAPQTDDELYWAVRAMWGVSLPRHTCGNIEHTAPFTAFADAYFERGHSTVLWHGSRGLSGKSYMLSVLGITKAFLKGADVNMLGGSLAQSTNIHEHMRTAMFNKDAPRYMIEKEGNNLIKLTNNARIRPLTASQKTVRGPHPPFLILDEIDEMDIDILDAALGQPMPQINYLGEEIKPFTVMCLAEGSDITVYGGNKPIEQVEQGDLVLTRDGWSPVYERIDNGYKETVSVELSNGRTLTCTPDHRIAVDNGWVEAQDLISGDVLTSVEPSQFSTPIVSDLPAGSALPTTMNRDESVVSGVFVPARAMSLGCVDSGGSSTTQDIDASRDRLQMVRVNTSSNTTQVVERPFVRDITDKHLIAKSMDWSSINSSIDHSVSSRGSSVPNPAPIIVNSDSGQKPVTVVSVSAGLLRHVYDLSVMGTPEFMAESIIVHNCSTWQNPEGTFTAIRRRFEDRGLPIVTWCYACSANPIDGWLSQETIEAKRLEIPAEMWRTEYELGEPAIGNRAFDPDAVEHVFNYPMEPIKEKIQKDFEEYTFEEPVKAGVYVAGADWGKEQDYTVISVMRADVQPAKLVYWMRVNRRPYPQMIGWFNKAINKYDCMAIHDGTGLGNVVNDYVDLRAQSFIMSGASRDGMLSEYVSAVENGRVQFPKFKSNYLAHKYARVGDIYGRGKDFHLPDEICSLALAWRLVKKHGFAGGDAVTIARDMSPTRSEAHFLPEPSNSDLVSGNKAVSVYVKNQKDEISLMA